MLWIIATLAVGCFGYYLGAVLHKPHLTVD
jgi:hypothetical protein